MKVKTSLRKRCENCYVVVREGRLFVYCRKNPRHKQTQPRPKEKVVKRSKYLKPHGVNGK